MCNFITSLKSLSQNLKQKLHNIFTFSTYLVARYEVATSDDIISLIDDYSKFYYVKAFQCENNPNRIKPEIKSKLSILRNTRTQFRHL